MRHSTPKRIAVSLMVATVLAAHPTGAIAGEVLARVQATGSMRVCMWTNYQVISYRDPVTHQLSGLDVDLSEQLAADLRVKRVVVESSFATLVKDLDNDRCDVAMFAVGMLPERLKHLAFTQPYMKSGIYGITTNERRVVRSWADIDVAGVKVGVLDGTFMVPVMTAALKSAQLVVIKSPATREQSLRAGAIDVFMADYPYSQGVLEQNDWLRLIRPPKPFFELPYAYAVKQGDGAWLQRLNDFVALIKADGRLERAAKQHGLSEVVVLP
jgi:cyclohexadienyl dehydratase